jgi:hypothetical protein
MEESGSWTDAQREAYGALVAGAALDGVTAEKRLE